MPEPLKSEDILACEYALGLLRGEERRAMSDRLASDARLRARVESWQSVLGELDTTEAEIDETPPAGLFNAILERIEAEGLHLPGTRTQRAEGARWKQISPGVMSRVLHIDRDRNRQSLLVKMEAGATYHPHAHDADEEAFVIEGDLWFGDLMLVAGDYHIAAAASEHPPGRTVGGCVVHVVTSLSA